MDSVGHNTLKAWAGDLTAVNIGVQTDAQHRTTRKKKQWRPAPLHLQQLGRPAEPT